MIPKFSIFYNDGSRYDGGGEDDEVVMIEVSKRWIEAPSDGVIAVVSEDPEINRAVFHNYDYYYQLPVNSDGRGYYGRASSLGPLLRRLGLVKFGTWTATDTYRQTVSRASSEDDWITGEPLKIKEPEDNSDEDN